MAGTDLREALALRDEPVVALTKSDLDITDSRCVARCVDAARPDVIVNCAAYTKVDQAEADESVATAINGSAVELLAQAANDAGALLVQLSTDFVFDGTKRTPYEINDATHPLSAYGRSKLLGELAATHAENPWISPPSGLFGTHGPNLVEAIRRQFRLGNPLRVVSDQRGRPTYTPHLAEAILRIVANDARGIVHYADEDECTWYDFACAIAPEVKTTPVSTKEFPRPPPPPPAPRIRCSRRSATSG